MKKDIEEYCTLGDVFERMEKKLGEETMLGIYGDEETFMGMMYAFWKGSKDGIVNPMLKDLVWKEVENGKRKNT